MDSQLRNTLIVVLLLFVLAEVALQWRAEVKFGNSIFSAVAATDNSVSMFEARDGFKILSANQRFDGSSISVQSNRLGLRSPELGQKMPGSSRLIVLGASSTYGAYARTNAETFPALLQQRLNGQLEVINAGIPGNDLDSQYQLYRQQLSGLHEDILIVYSGLSNDIGRLCRKQQSGKSYALPQLSAPKWLLSVDLLLKNTTDLRYVPYKYQPMPDLASLLAQYQTTLQAIIQLAKQRGVQHILLAENLTSFRPEQPLSLQQALASSALYYTPCLDVQQFSEVFRQYNHTLAQVAVKQQGVHYLPLSHLVPGGRQHFTDSVHFTAKGEQAMADALAEALRGLPEMAK